MAYPGDSDVAEAFQKWPLRFVIIGLVLIATSTLLIMISDLPLDDEQSILLVGPGLALTIAIYLGCCLFILGILTYIFARIIGRRR